MRACVRVRVQFNVSTSEKYHTGAGGVMPEECVTLDQEEATQRAAASSEVERDSGGGFHSFKRMRFAVCSRAATATTRRRATCRPTWSGSTDSATWWRQKSAW